MLREQQQRLADLQDQLAHLRAMKAEQDRQALADAQAIGQRSDSPLATLSEETGAIHAVNDARVIALTRKKAELERLDKERTALLSLKKRVSQAEIHLDQSVCANDLRERRWTNPPPGRLACR